MGMEAIELHGRSYRLPTRPTVVICADGCDPAYIEAGLKAGVLPTVARWREAGFYALADAVMPTFTNPNNMSIVTGAPPSVHGISGNFALDRDSPAEGMMTDPKMLRSDTILALMSQPAAPTAAITAQAKLRLIRDPGPRARRAQGAGFASDARQAPGAPRGVGRRRRADRRSRHERQGVPRRPPACPLPRRHPERPFRHRRGAGHLPDHRPVRAPS